jgi:heme/copper-type cytochrome/quinol oxidase subunit 2
MMSNNLTTVRPRTAWLVALVGLAVAVAGAVAIVAQTRRDFDVHARKYEFTVAGNAKPEIHVQQDDLVHITFSADDIAHSFTIDDDHYRIMRRAEPGKPVTFDFRASHPGRFRFYCSLKIDERCREMEGWLIVDPK